jgi:hypothetical protein
MKTIRIVQLICLVFMMCVFIDSLPIVINAADVPRMDKDELRKLLDNPDVIILDVRIPSEWDQSGFKIKGAKRLENIDSMDKEMNLSKDKTLVLYCA